MITKEIGAERQLCPANNVRAAARPDMQVSGYRAALTSTARCSNSPSPVSSPPEEGQGEGQAFEGYARFFADRLRVAGRAGKILSRSGLELDQKRIEYFRCRESDPPQPSRILKRDYRCVPIDKIVLK